MNTFTKFKSVTSIEGCMLEVDDSFGNIDSVAWTRLRSYGYSKGFKSLRDLDLHSSSIGPNNFIEI
jgi:hypothetical protein